MCSFFIYRARATVTEEVISKSLAQYAQSRNLESPMMLKHHEETDSISTHGFEQKKNNFEVTKRTRIIIAFIHTLNSVFAVSGVLGFWGIIECPFGANELFSKIEIEKQSTKWPTCNTLRRRMSCGKIFESKQRVALQISKSS